MMILLVIVGISLIIFGGFVLIKPGLITAFEGVGVKVSAPAGLIIIIIGAAGVWYPMSPYGKPSGPDRFSRGTVSTGSRVVPPNATAPIKFAFISPSDGTGVRGKFRVQGTAPNLGKNELRLFVKDTNITNVPYHFISNIPPLKTVMHIWSGDVGSLGASPDAGIGHIFQLQLVLANPKCSDELAQYVSNSGSPRPEIRNLPPGCRYVGQPLYVKKE